MMRKAIGGVITLVIGGTLYTVSQGDIAKNFSANTGVSQTQAEQYVNNIKPSDLASFSKIGASLVNDGNSVLSTNIDCVDYTYKWQTSSLSCEDGKSQLETVGRDEVTLGNCYEALDTNLGDSGKAKIQECISDIDSLNSDYSLPIVAVGLDSNTIADTKNSNAYNKSVLQAALSK